MELGILKAPFINVDDFSEEEKQAVIEELEAEHQSRVLKAFKRSQYQKKFTWIREDYREAFIVNCKWHTLAGNAQVFVDHFESHFRKLGLYIYGTPGTGKTYLASMIANEIAIRGFKVYMAPMNEAILSYNDQDDDTLKTLISQRYFDVIILDDFGSSRLTDYQIEQIYNLINGIYQSRCSLTITTNIPRAELSKPEDLRLRRIYDRIIEMTSGIPAMIGASKRMTNAVERAPAISGMFAKED